MINSKSCSSRRLLSASGYPIPPDVGLPGTGGLGSGRGSVLPGTAANDASTPRDNSVAAGHHTASFHTTGAQGGRSGLGRFARCLTLVFDRRRGVSDHVIGSSIAAILASKKNLQATHVVSFRTPIWTLLLQTQQQRHQAAFLILPMHREQSGVKRETHAESFSRSPRQWRCTNLDMPDSQRSLPDLPPTGRTASETRFACLSAVSGVASFGEIDNRCAQQRTFKFHL